MGRGALWIVVAAIFGVLAGVADNGLADDGLADDERSPAGATVEEGRRLYRALCAGCHGRSGDGQGPVADSLTIAPRDLTRAEYRFRSTPSGSLPTRADLIRTLELGLPGTPMPSWGEQLSRQQMSSVVLYVETLSKRFADRTDPPTVLVDLSTLKAPPTMEDTLERGQMLYGKMRCGKCHGETGEGDGIAAADLSNNDGSAADVFDFSYGVYKGGYGPAAVYRTFVTGLDGTPMPSFGEALPNEADRWALVHYCRSLTQSRGAWFYLSEPPGWEEPISSGE